MKLPREHRPNNREGIRRKSATPVRQIYIKPNAEPVMFNKNQLILPLNTRGQVPVACQKWKQKPAEKEKK